MFPEAAGRPADHLPVDLKSAPFCVLHRSCISPWHRCYRISCLCFRIRSWPLLLPHALHAWQLLGLAGGHSCKRSGMVGAQGCTCRHIVGHCRHTWQLAGMLVRLQRSQGPVAVCHLCQVPLVILGCCCPQMLWCLLVACGEEVAPLAASRCFSATSGQSATAAGEFWNAATPEATPAPARLALVGRLPCATWACGGSQLPVVLLLLLTVVVLLLLLLLLLVVVPSYHAATDVALLHSMLVEGDGEFLSACCCQLLLTVLAHVLGAEGGPGR